MLAVVTALKVPKPGTQGNSTFEVLCAAAHHGAAQLVRPARLRAQSDASHCFGGEMRYLHCYQWLCEVW